MLNKFKNHLIKSSRAIYVNRNHYMQAATLSFSIIKATSITFVYNDATKPNRHKHQRFLES